MKLKRFSHQLNFKNNRPVLLFIFKAIFRHRNCFVSPTATDGKDGYRLKLENVGPTFSSVNAMPAKLTKKIIMVIAALWNLFDICFIALQEYFVYVITKFFFSAIHTCIYKNFKVAALKDCNKSSSSSSSFTAYPGRCHIFDRHLDLSKVSRMSFSHYLLGLPLSLFSTIFPSKMIFPNPSLLFKWPKFFSFNLLLYKVL